LCSAFESAASQFAELLQVSGSNTAGANYHTPFPFPQHTRTLSTKDFSVSPDPLPGLRPWTPLGDFRTPDLLNWPPPSSFSGSAPDNNNNNYYYNSHGNVYGAVIMTKVIARVHPVHLMNVD